MQTVCLNIPAGAIENISDLQIKQVRHAICKSHHEKRSVTILNPAENIDVIDIFAFPLPSQSRIRFDHPNDGGLDHGGKIHIRKIIRLTIDVLSDVQGVKAQMIFMLTRLQEVPDRPFVEFAEGCHGVGAVRSVDRLPDCWNRLILFLADF